MAVGIAHAVMSENKDRYGEVGDQLQTGATDDRKGEIRLADWYDRSGGWDEYLECTDGELAANAAAWAVKIANSKNYGYSRGGGVKDGRWSGYKSIKSVGFDQGKGNFDCSSLVISCYVFAGCPNLKPTGYTGNISSLLHRQRSAVCTLRKERTRLLWFQAFRLLLLPRKPRKRKSLMCLCPALSGCARSQVWTAKSCL